MSDVSKIWESAKEEFQRNRENFRRSSRGRGNHPGQFRYPDDIAGPFPTFSTWLNERVRSLRQEQFPLSNELLELHCPPSSVALSFKAMWAYGCYFRCQTCYSTNYVSFDSGIAAITPDSSTIDVGILKDILLLTYGKINCVVMRGEWMKPIDQGRSAVRKDRLGFWSMLYDARTRNPGHNPFVYPSTVSQVYFMDEDRNPGWKVVLHHEPRSRRVTQDREFIDIDAAGERFPLPSGSTGEPAQYGSHEDNMDGEMVRATEVPPIQNGIYTEDDDAILNDDDYEDEMELQYVD